MTSRLPTDPKVAELHCLTAEVMKFLKENGIECSSLFEPFRDWLAKKITSTEYIVIVTDFLETNKAKISLEENSEERVAAREKAEKAFGAEKAGKLAREKAGKLAKEKAKKLADEEEDRKFLLSIRDSMKHDGAIAAGSKAAVDFSLAKAKIINRQRKINQDFLDARLLGIQIPDPPTYGQ